MIHYCRRHLCSFNTNICVCSDGVISVVFICLMSSAMLLCGSTTVDADPELGDNRFIFLFSLFGVGPIIIFESEHEFETNRISFEWKCIESRNAAKKSFVTINGRQ